MRKFQLKDFMKSAGAFWLVSASGIDSAILSFDRLGWLRAGNDWYLTGPLIAWGVVSLPLSIALFERMRDSAYEHPKDIQPILTDGSATARAIPFMKNGQPGTLMAYAVNSIFGNQDYEPPARQKVIGWQVGDIQVGVNELSRFLELCDRRPKYKFSMRYWVERRKPGVPRKKYDAYMRLLNQAGLIEARQSGASGWLRGGLKPRHAIEYLTDSKGRAAGLAVFSG